VAASAADAAPSTHHPATCNSAGASATATATSTASEIAALAFLR